MNLPRLNFRNYKQKKKLFSARQKLLVKPAKPRRKTSEKASFINIPQINATAAHKTDSNKSQTLDTCVWVPDHLRRLTCQPHFGQLHVPLGQATDIQPGAAPLHVAALHQVSHRLCARPALCRRGPPALFRRRTGGTVRPVRQKAGWDQQSPAARLWTFSESVLVYRISVQMLF